eukprot:CAMPEP_0185910326 /NCGR_PEP_ID=MMETSP0196C-20130402/18573_1 /TAXON_ID=2932 /ORGANISM="Alexandrium fundyense, Strain CCMP1719" /LENGTH=31 /DNA_ID= /DNA_START= /DNA_END= /DNA_ORIENTATION=
MCNGRDEAIQVDISPQVRPWLILGHAECIND